MNEQQWNAFQNFINIFALGIGLENLQENRAQSRYNDVYAANDKQAEYLLGEIKALFAEQNAMLERIIAKMEKSNDENIQQDN